SIPTSFNGITASWVRHLRRADGSRPYSRHGWAHLALRPITIYSTRKEIIKAYRYIKGIKKQYPENYSILNDTTNFLFKVKN
ncbi:MAG: hypothetical protein JST68_25200, partial [Bacteroidetes bacterium]|nr:hypothetical protein [Bacteroidota bacterium]